MYGFVEKWLADLFGFQYDPFGLTSGEEAALVGRQAFDRIFNIMTEISSEQGRTLPQIFNSDVAGTRIASHEFWVDDDVFDGLTGGDVKQTGTYLEIQAKGRGSSRFDFDELKELLVSRYIDTPTTAVEDEDEPDEPEDVDPPDEPVAEEAAGITGEAGVAMVIDEAPARNEMDTAVRNAMDAAGIAAANLHAQQQNAEIDALAERLQRDPNHAAVIDDGTGPRIIPTQEVDPENAPGIYEGHIDTTQTNERIVIQGGDGYGIMATGGATGDAADNPAIGVDTGNAAQTAYTYRNADGTVHMTVEEATERLVEEGEPMQADVAEAVEEPVEKDLLDDVVDKDAEVAKKAPQKTPGQKFVQRIRDQLDISISIQGVHSVGDTDNDVVICDFGTAPRVEPLIEFAKTINKNVFVLTEQGTSLLRTMRRRLKDFNEIFSHSVFISMWPRSNPSFQRQAVAGNTLCLGSEIRDLYIVKGKSVQEQIDAVRCDDGLTANEKEEQISRINDSALSSSYSRYDQVFKDTATNVVWAVRDRCMVYLMFDPRGGQNSACFAKIMTELGRRFDGKTPYHELRRIDLEYQKEIDLENRKHYVEFAVESSKTVINELRKQFTDARAKYKSFLDQAMEWAKLTQKYQDQIEAFDEDGFAAKEREKAEKGYDETLGIDKVSSVYVKDGMIHVYTHNIYAQDERTEKWHDIGTFHVTVGMMSNTYDTSNTVKITNTKHQITGMETAMQAPHVFPNGSICHGNLATGMIEAYKRRNLFELVMQLILFLQTANTNDAAGKYINNWPEVSKETAIAVEEVDVEDTFLQISEAEKQFDDALADAIPLHI